MRVYSRKTVEERFWSKVDKNGPIHPTLGQCWVWTGAFFHNGYGNLWAPSLGETRAHRVSYRLFRGEIPPRLLVLHGCDNPSCVNPSHLEVGTVSQNQQDMARRGRSVRLVGTRCGRAKLTADNVREIRHLASGGASYRELAERFGVHKDSVGAAVRRETYSEVP